MIFNITDEGIGIPQDKLEEIFKPFSRIDNNESLIEGSGFGLFVVKGLIDLLNGKINVSSEVGKGSNFTIRIPVAFIERKEIIFEGFQIWDSFFLDMLYEWHEEKFGYYYEDEDDEEAI